jgi:hypothetical protein
MSRRKESMAVDMFLNELYCAHGVNIRTHNCNRGCDREADWKKPWAK